MTMRFFIDFEAVPSGEIVSIGCKCLDSEYQNAFYSLIKPRHNPQTSNILTGLTHITQEMIDTAPKSDDVFTDFFTWLYDTASMNNNVVFYCYGTEDRRFIETTLKYSECFCAKAALGLVLTNLIDISLKVKNFFKADMVIGLQKVINYIDEQEKIQKHDALEDAIMLERVYVFCENKNNKVNECPFPGYVRTEEMKKEKSTNVRQEKINKYKEKTIIVNNKTKLQGVDEAAAWVVRHFENNLSQLLKTLSEEEADFYIKNKIANAIENNKKYLGKTWKVK